MTETNRRQRLRFRSWHRGTREMDLLLGSFADAHIDQFTSEQLDQYEAILQLADSDLYPCLAGIEPMKAEQDGAVMQMLCKHNYKEKSG